MFILVLVVIFGTGVVSSIGSENFATRELCEEQGKISLEFIQQMGDIGAYRCVEQGQE